MRMSVAREREREIERKRNEEREREREREREKEREEGDGWDYLYRMEKCWVLNRVADHTESAIKDWVMTEINNMAHSIIRNK